MKIAITSQGSHFDAQMDERFSRCDCFVIFDSETGGVEFLPNLLKDKESEIGKPVVDLMCKRGVSKIISGDFGIKVKPILDSKKIQMIVYKDETISIRSIISLLQQRYTVKQF